MNNEDLVRCPRCNHVTPAHYVVSKSRRRSMLAPTQASKLYCPQCETTWKPKKIRREE